MQSPPAYRPPGRRAGRDYAGPPVVPCKAMTDPTLLRMNSSGKASDIWWMAFQPVQCMGEELGTDPEAFANVVHRTLHLITGHEMVHFCTPIDNGAVEKGEGAITIQTLLQKTTALDIPMRHLFSVSQGGQRMRRRTVWKA